jgi:hypothetical protein
MSKNQTKQPSTFKVPPNPGPHPKQKRLDARRADYNSVSSKPGFHRPGSYNK